MLEAVSHRLRHTVDPQPDAIAFNFFDPCGEGLARELHHLDRRVVDPRWVAAAWHGDPDLARQLGGQLVKLQCGQQAEHGLWHLGGDCAQALELRHLCIRQAIETTPDPLQQPSGIQPCEDDPWCIDGIQVAGAQKSSLADQIEDTLGMGFGKHAAVCSVISSNTSNRRQIGTIRPRGLLEIGAHLCIEKSSQLIQKDNCRKKFIHRSHRSNARIESC